MRTLIVFASYEGHTQALAQIAAETFHRAGQETWICDAEEPNLPKPADFDAALLASPVHRGEFDARLRRYAKRHHVALNAMPSAFISVSLGAASNRPGDLAALDALHERFKQETGWWPSMTHRAKGAVRYRSYGFLTKLVARLLDSDRDPAISTAEDYDLTDYEALHGFLGAFADEAAHRAPAAA